jgi:PTH1 family peptidyl-tRNA hydrolase
VGVAKLCVGLGNPGRQYQHTRHNIGFLVLMELARRSGVEWKKSRHAEALTAEVAGHAGEGILLVLPTTFMNNSGHAVKGIAHFHQVIPAQTLVVVDDIRLDFGVMRLRSEGSDGGHNGLRSVAAAIESRQYPRLRLGVGASPPGFDQADYVLSEFSARERKDLPGFISGAADCCGVWMEGDMPRAMTQYNQRKEEKHNE